MATWHEILLPFALDQTCDVAMQILLLLGSWQSVQVERGYGITSAGIEPHRQSFTDDVDVRQIVIEQILFRRHTDSTYW